MSDFSTKKCDCCGKLKQEANHWLVVVRSPLGCCILPAGSDLVTEVKVGLSSPTSPANTVEVFDACGDDCSHKMLSEWLQRLAGGADG